MEDAQSFRLRYPQELWQARRYTPYLNTPSQPTHVDSLRSPLEAYKTETWGAWNAHVLSTEERNSQRQQHMYQRVYAPTVPLHRRQRIVDVGEHQETGRLAPGHGSPHKVAQADLVCHLPAPPGARKRSSHVAPLRWEDDWIRARFNEDRSLFVSPAPSPTASVESPASATRRPNVQKWVEIQQSRYFWDFVDSFIGKPDVTDFDAEPHRLLRRDEQHSKATKTLEKAKAHAQAIFRQERNMIERLEAGSKKNVITVERPFSYLPSIFESPPPVSTVDKQHTKEGALIPFQNAAQYGREVINILKTPPFREDFQRWCVGTLSLRHQWTDQEERIMEFFHAHSEKQLPPGMKSFEALYPDLPEEVLKQIQIERAEREGLKIAKRGEPETFGLPRAPREVKKVGGGRYALR